MSTKRSKNDIIKQKEFLAAESLRLANQALGYLEDQISECSTRDLVAIFSSAVKTHRDIISDIVALQDSDSPSEMELAKQYSSTVDKLLDQIRNKGS